MHPSPNATQTLADDFIDVSRRQFRTRLERIEVCVGRLSEDQLWSRAHEVENAVGNLVLHLCGNIRQWILSGVGGAADDRDRDAEFARRDPLPAEELTRRLRDVIDEADAVIARLSPADLAERRQIQGYDVTLLEAVYHVVEHLAEHTGQIIWATKRATGADLGFYRYLTDPDRSGDLRP